MSLIRHLLLALAYGAFAVAVALTLPMSVAGLDGWTAVALGGAVLCFGAVLHESLDRQARDKAAARAVEEAEARHDSVLDQIAELRDRLGLIERRLERAPDAGRLETLSGELGQLKALIRRLAGGEDAGQGGRADRDGPRDAAGRLIEGEAPEPPGLVDRVREAVRQDLMDASLAPIVALPQRKIRHRLVGLRLLPSEGGPLEPPQWRPVAERVGLIAATDAQLLFRCAQHARDAARRHRAGGWFAPVSPTSLADPGFVDQVADFLFDNGEVAARLVIQLPADALIREPEGPRAAMARLAATGVRFALGDANVLARLDLPEIGALGVRFLGINARTLIAEAEGGLDTQALRARLDAQAIDLIAEGVDREETVAELLDLPVAFARGSLFAEIEAAAA
ncbi:MAG: EAL domain-containing protein [Azospirillaceae bacterium]